MKLRKFTGKVNIYDLLYWFIILYAVFSRISGIQKILNYVFYILLIAFVAIYSKNFLKIFKTNKLILYILPFLVIVILQIVFYSGPYLFDNVKYSLNTLLLLITVCMLSAIKPDYFERKIINGKNFFNIIGFINLAILSIQVSGYPLFIKASDMSANTFYADNCSGLFGGSGTHELSFFVLFLIIYNLFIISDSKKSNMFLKIWTIFLSVWMISLSRLNDNKAFTILILISVCIFYFFRQYWESKKHINRIGKILLFLLVFLLLYYLCAHIPFLSDFYEKTEKLFYTLTKFANGYTSTNGSNERLAIFLYSLTQDFGWRLGMGLGSIDINAKMDTVFYHISINSISTLTYYGGIWYYISHILVNIGFFKSWKLSKTDHRWNIAVIVIIVMLTIYSQIYTSPVSIIWVTLIFYIFYLLKNKKERKRKS